MPDQQIGQQRNPLGGRDIRQANNARMRGAKQVNQRAEITVDRYENPAFVRRHPQQRRVARVRLLLPGGPDIVPTDLQPRRQTLAGAAIDQKLQAWATTTSSSRSLATTAWA